MCHASTGKSMNGPKEAHSSPDGWKMLGKEFLSFPLNLEEGTQRPHCWGAGGSSQAEELMVRFLFFTKISLVADRREDDGVWKLEAGLPVGPAGSELQPSSLSLSKVFLRQSAHPVCTCVQAQPTDLLDISRCSTMFYRPLKVHLPQQASASVLGPW